MTTYFLSQPRCRLIALMYNLWHTLQAIDYRVRTNPLSVDCVANSKQASAAASNAVKFKSSPEKCAKCMTDKIPDPLKCNRCGHEWVPIVAIPVLCPHCRSRYWNKPRVRPRPASHTQKLEAEQ